MEGTGFSQSFVLTSLHPAPGEVLSLPEGRLTCRRVGLEGV